MEIIGVIFSKAGNGKAFALGKGDWYNVEDATLLAPFNKGDNVKVIWDKKGVAKIASKIEKVSKEISASTGTPKQNTPTPTPQQSGSYQKSGYESKEDHPNKALAMRLGNALNAASTVMSNPNIILTEQTPEAYTQATIEMAMRFFDYLELKNNELKI